MNEGIKALVGQIQTMKTKFLGKELLIQKLTYQEVMEIKALADKAKADESGSVDDQGFELLKTVIRKGAQGGKDLTDDEFANFPLDELSKLSAEIMKFSGIGGEEKPGK